eukprot:TRINITY_DN8322_c0_g1_i1.p1 TRINITY_DN8322_c0_g1~~TRINITY_DN8322_c0_g1_i1.p1  ORF type:complete len:132 (+),score=13.22 TRINITY_DN8322_c0_g1_i1:265-660(+)
MSTKSDVWSFGVVIWEVMTNCLQLPYSGMSHTDVVKKGLVGELVLNLPATCHTELSDLVNSCLQVKPETRPPFEEIQAKLSQIRKSLPGDDDVFISETECKTNVPDDTLYLKTLLQAQWMVTLGLNMEFLM